MPLIDVKCLACGETFEHYRPVSEWPNTPACKCGGATEQAHLPKQIQWSVDPVVVFQAPDGTMRFPGEADGASSRKYESMGYQRHEIRGATEMRRFEKHMDRQEYSRASRKVEQAHAQRELREKQTRAAMYESMQHMSARGRDIARAMIDRNNAKPQPRAHEAGFHSEIYSMDRSNRAESRDSQGRRRRD